MPLVIELRDDPVDLRDLVAHRIPGQAAREDREKQNLRVRKIPPELEDDGADALGDLGRGEAAGVVRADHEHHGLRLKSLAFAVPQTPQDALRRVSRDREVGGPHVAEVFVEDRLVCVLQPPVGDRVAVKEQIDLALLRGGDESFVARPHPLVGLRESRRDVQPRGLQQHQRFELLQQRLDG